MVVAMIALPLMGTMLFCINPSDIRFATSLLPLPPTIPTWAYIIICTCYGAIITVWHLSSVGTGVFYLVICILSSYVTFQILREVKGGQNFYMSRPILRRPPRLCHLYRALQILVRLWNNALKTMMFPLKGSAQAFAIVGNCILIKFHRMDTPLANLILLLGPNVYLFVWLYSLYLWGQVFQKSGVCIRSWQYLRIKEYSDFVLLRKFRRSAPPLKIRIGEMYFVRPNRVVVTIHSVIRQMFKSLLSIKKQIH